MEGLHIELVEKGRELPMDLLLLADPSAEMISDYIHNCSVFIASVNGEMVACYALLPIDEKLIEIKNIAVAERYQGKGIGTLLIKDAIKTAKQLGYKKIRIGTGNSSSGQLQLYQKLGFIRIEVIEGFFQKNYAQPIVENGIECVDMIVLERNV